MAYGNRHSAGTIWLPTGNPDTTNISPADFGTSLTSVSMGGQPGGLGLRFEGGFPDRTYQRVQLDSGASAASSSGVVAANELAYWKDKSKYIVTNDAVQANAANIPGLVLANSGFRNFIAGVFRAAVTAGNVCDIIQAGRSIPVKTTGTAAAGDNLVGDTSTTAAQAAVVTAGTAITIRSIGIAASATVASVTPTDLDIPGTE